MLADMKTLKILIRIEAVLLALLGWLEAFANRNLGEAGANRAPQDDLALSFLGTGFLVFAVLLFLGSDLMLAGNRRRLGWCLAGGNALLALSAFVHGSGEPLDWILLLAPLLMAVALVWASALPLKPEDAAAQLADLRIPDEVRHALLRQVGESAAQEERNRLARDLHDSIKQQLFTINVGAATAQERWDRDPEGAQAALVDVRRSAREAMVEMQAMLHQLRPQALTSATGLVEALREQAEALGYRSGAQVTVELGPEIPDDRMPPGALEALFRIAQEALANVARHARAETVRIWIGAEGEGAVLRVEDDGQGFDPKAVVSGMGLRNLRERAAALRGRVDIESEPGAGSTVRAGIPLLPAAAPAKEPLKRWLMAMASPFGSYGWMLVSLALTFDRDLWPKVMSGLFSFTLVLSAIGQRGSGHSEPPNAYLRFKGHRGSFIEFFSAAGMLSWSWMSDEQGLKGTYSVWMICSILCLAFSFVEMAGFHRWSEPRREWRLKMPSDLWIPFVLQWLTSFGVFAFAIVATVSDPDPARIVTLSLMVASLLYILSRQPRSEGARR